MMDARKKVPPTMIVECAKRQIVMSFMAEDPFKLHQGIVSLWETRQDDAQAYFSSDLTDPFYCLHYAEVAFQTALLVESPETEKEAMNRLFEAEARMKERLQVQSSWVKGILRFGWLTVSPFSLTKLRSQATRSPCIRLL